MTRPGCEDTVVIANRNLRHGYHALTLGPFGRAVSCRPGQFVHVRIPSAEVFFRRAFSVAGITATGGIEIILKVVGRGTRVLAGLHRGAVVNLLGPLGKPFRLPLKNETTLMVAGGVGFPPLLFLAAEMISRGCNPKQIVFFYGGRSEADVIGRSRLKRLGVVFRPVTEDGSLGETGLVTEPVQEYMTTHRDQRLRIYACGPPGMIKAADQLGRSLGVPGQLSLEAPMPCGLGLCLGCVVPLTDGGQARVCCDGPVFNIGEVIL